jgi:hypothetical protein
MKTRFTVFIFMASILTMAIFSSIMNFVSAAVPTGTSCEEVPVVGGWFCTTTFDDGTVSKQYCYKDKDGIGICQVLKSKPIPPEIEQAIQNSIQEVAPTNPNDSKDLGGMKSDKGITKSPIE